MFCRRVFKQPKPCGAIISLMKPLDETMETHICCSVLSRSFRAWCEFHGCFGKWWTDLCVFVKKYTVACWPNLGQFKDLSFIFCYPELNGGNKKVLKWIKTTNSGFVLKMLTTTFHGKSLLLNSAGSSILFLYLFCTPLLLFEWYSLKRFSKYTNRFELKWNFQNVSSQIGISN